MADELTNYIEDDWDDNALSGRTSPQKGIYYNYHDGGTGNLLKGVYRPIWNQINGADISATNGQVEIYEADNQSNVIETPSSIMSGSFSLDAEISSDGSNRVHFLFINNSVGASMSDSYGVWKNAPYAASNDTLHKTVSGTHTKLITGPTSNITRRSYRATRDSYGNLELFVNGSSYGTSTDTEIESTEFVQIQNSASSDSHYVYADNLVVQ